MDGEKKIGPREVDAALGSDQMDNVSRYAAEGRRFQGEAIEKLRDRYLARFREAYEGDAPAPGVMKEFEDVASEFSLRGDDAPTPPPEVMEMAYGKLQAVGRQVLASPLASALLARALASKLSGGGS